MEVNITVDAVTGVCTSERRSEVDVEVDMTPLQMVCALDAISSAMSAAQFEGWLANLDVVQSMISDAVFDANEDT